MQAGMIAEFLSELVEDHVQKCDGDRMLGTNEPIAHIIDTEMREKRMIQSTAMAALGAEYIVVITLDDGSQFNVRVSAV